MEKPFEKYFGGKEGKGVYQSIINQIPPHSFYMELYVGNGAIFRKKKASLYTLLCDKSPKVVAEWEKLGVQKVHFSDWEFNPKKLCIVNECAIELLKIDFCECRPLDFEGNFIYLDPPYPIHIRKQQRPVYECEMTIQEHNDLLEVISCYRHSKIMISSYPNEIYDEALTTWRKVDFVGRTEKGTAIERIYMNYPEPTELHDYRYLGRNFRERWVIEKSTRNIINKFKRLPILQRNAVLDAVNSQLKSSTITPE